MAAPKFSCVLLGEEPLLSQCGELLLELEHRIAGVVTTHPDNIRWAREHGLAVWDKATWAARAAQGPVDLLLSITWPWLIPPEVLASARRLAINFHDGPLPRYAGMNGSAWALLRGETQHAIVWHVMTPGLDDGDILKRRDLVLDPRETSVSLHIKNAGAALESFLELINELEAGTETRTPQDKSIERFVLSRHDRPEALAVLDLKKSAHELDRLVRACDHGPYGNAFGAAKLMNGARAVLVDEVEIDDAEPGRPAGTVTAVDARRFTVTCGTGSLSVVRARTPDGAPLSPAAAAAALGAAPGDRLVDDTADVRARWTRRIAEAEPFFRKRLLGIAAREPLQIPFAAPRDAQPGPALQIPLLDGDGAPAARVAALLADGGAALIAALAFACSALCGRDDVVLAVARGAQDKGLARLRDLLLPALPLAVDIDDGAGFDVLLRQVRAALDALSERPAALRDLLARTPPVSGLRDRGLSPVGVLLDAPAGDVEIIPGTALVLAVSPTRAALVVDPRALRESEARGFAARLGRVAARLLQEPDRPLRAVDLLGDDEREQVVFGWNATAAPFPADERLHDRFEAQAQERPNALAVVCESQRATFAELDAQANRIARALIARGAAPGRFVAFCLPRGIELVATMLAVAKTGAAYVPIDKSYPRDRARFMVDDAGALLVVTTDKLAERFAGLPLLIVDGQEVSRAAATRPECPARATDPCYAIYTSGSTGQPKGVVLTHRAVVNTLAWVSRTFAIGPADRVLFVTSPSFDLSVYDVFGALGAGAVVEVASTERLSEPALLVRRIVESGVTVWDSAPPALARLVPFLPKRAGASSLRLVMLSGDWIPVKLPDQLRAVFPDVRVKSLGGATEAAIWSNFYDIETVDPTWTSIPYGRPIDNARYMVLDRRLRPLPPGVAGDLVIGGVCLAEGYLGRADLTAERFVPDPFRPGERIYKTGDLARFWEDGTLEFLGRSDSQVKIRGHRVELGEIELLLGTQPDVREAVVLARRDASGEKILVAYAVPDDGATLDGAGLKRALAARLPDFMVPSFVVPLARLPLTQNGKLDRRALPEPDSGRHERVAARTATERELVRVWSELLRTSAIGVTDSFFDLGGHSLLAAMLVTRMRTALGVDLPLSRLISHPTIEALAHEIDRRRGPGIIDERSSLVPLRERGDKPPLFLVAGIGGHVFGMRDLALRLPEDQPVYAFRAIGAEGEALPKDSIEEIARAYEPEVLAAARGRPVVLGGYSFGALVAFELARRLRRRGVPIVRVALLDVFAPGYPNKKPLPQRVLLHAEHFVGLDLTGKRAYVVDRARNVARRALVGRGLGALVAPRLEVVEDEKEQQLRRLWAALAQAQQKYAPGGPDAGPVTLFRASVDPTWPGVVFDDDAHGWRAWVTGPLEVVRLRGGHLDVFAPDNLEVIGRVLSDRLK